MVKSCDKCVGDANITVRLCVQSCRTLCSMSEADTAPASGRAAQQFGTACNVFKLVTPACSPIHRGLHLTYSCKRSYELWIWRMLEETAGSCATTFDDVLCRQFDGCIIRCTQMTRHIKLSLQESLLGPRWHDVLAG